MKKFFDQVDALHESNSDMRECIINFDQKLSLKLNKSQLLTMKQDIGTSFLPHEYKDVVEDRFARFERSIDKNTDLVETVADECRDKVNDLVQESIETQLKDKFSKYDNIAS